MQQLVYRIAKVLSKGAVFTVTLGAFLGVLVIAVTQLEPFRKWAIETGLERVNEQLAGKLSVGDIDGNLVTGITIKDVTLEAGNTTFAKVPTISLRYELLPILESRRVGASVILNKPKILLQRDSEGVWNFSRIAMPDLDSLDDPRSPLAWTFDVSSIEIRDGEVEIRDLTADRRGVIAPGDRPAGLRDIDFLNTRLRRLNLEAGTFISEERQSFVIRHLSFLEESSGIRLVELAGAVDIDQETGTTIEGLRVETEGSLLELDLALETPSLFDSTFGSQLLDGRFELALDGDRVDANELRRLLPSLDFLADTYGLDLEVDGTLDDMNVERLELIASGSRLDITGRLTDITDPDRYRIEARMLSGSRLRYRDMKRHLPGLDLSAVSYLEEVDFESIRYEGRPSDATATFDFASSVGDVIGGGYVSWAEGSPGWRGDLLGRDVNLSRIIPDGGEYGGSVNGRFVVEGNGFDPERLEARVRARIGESEIAGRNVSHGWIDGAYGEGGMIVIDTALVALGGDGSGSSALTPPDLDQLYPELLKLRNRPGATDFTTRIALLPRDVERINGRQSARLAGWFDMRDPDLPSYRGVVEADRLDLSTITLNPEHNTRLGFSMRVEGRGIDPDNIEGIVQLDAYDIMLPNGEEILPFQIDSLVVEQEGATRRVLLASDVADAEISGKWRFESLFPTLIDGFEKLADYVARKSSYRSEEMAALVNESPTDLEPIAATYRIETKDLSIVEAFMPGREFEFDADLSGTISGTRSFLGLTLSGEVRRFLYAEGDERYRFGGVELDAEIRNVSSGMMDDLLDAEISIRSDSLYSIAGTTIDAPDLQLSFSEGRLRLDGTATVDGEYTVSVDGGVDVVAEQGYRLGLDSLTFGLANGLKWRNQGPISLIASEDGVEIEEFNLSRSRAETISVTGRFDEFERFEDVTLTVSSVPFVELRPFIVDPDLLDMLSTLGGRLDSLHVDLTGTLENPEMEIAMAMEKLVYTRVAIGSIEFDANYRDRNLNGVMRIVGAVNNPTDTVPVLANVQINRLPIDLAFAPREKRFLSSEPIDITGETDELPLGILGPFVPGILIQKGTTDMKFAISGRFPDVDYSGTGKVNGGQLLVESTNVPYLVDARFDLREERLELQGVSLRNLPSDYADGKANAFGTITFDGFMPKRFDIGIRTNGLLVLSDATQAVNDLYYGDLVVATNPGSRLTFDGTYDRPRLHGDITILRSDLKYPYRDRISELSNRVEFVEFEEWIEPQIGPPSPPPGFVAPPAPSDTVVSRDTSEQNPVIPSTSLETDFMDRLLVELKIRVPKGVKLTIELGLLNQLELIIDDGEDDKPLDFSMLGDDMNLTGEVRLLKGSEFTLLRTFEATGAVTFDENILNPEFNIQGEYFGRRFQNGATQPYTVEVLLEGSLEVPEISFDYTIEGEASNDDKAQKQADALFLLLAGRRQSELFSATSSEEDLATDALLSSTNAFGTDVLGAALSGVFQDIGGLQTVEFDGSIDDPGGTTFAFVYAVGDVLVRYEGRVTRLSDGTVTIELPLELLLNMSEFKNLSLQLQRDIVDQFGGSLAPTNAANSVENVFRVRLSLRYTF